MATKTTAECQAELDRLEQLMAPVRAATNAGDNFAGLELDRLGRLWDRAKAEYWAAARRGNGCPETVTGGVTGGEVDVEANYPGGLAAFRRDERPDRTPRHKGEIEGY